ncbi:Nuclease associated modular domain 3 [uncultured Caudovirales phage]|uniref:Nuclease associated modular domain 3 n=1 Tax=uncultured Caudovirales phage TaxID=2100421 RepID=A0A6J5KQQ3_9CAUD|nr:Nuclease associated modular domain 3 [uncultured Caudovirales phage]
MRLYFLYKTTNLRDERVYHGIHLTDDLYFGTPNSVDTFCGDTAEIRSILKLHGRQVFHVETICAYPIEEDANKHLDKLLKTRDANSYNRVIVRTPEQRARTSEVNLGEKNPFYGQKHSDKTKGNLSSYRKSVRWITDGVTERQIGAHDDVAPGWRRGRLKKSTTDSSKSQ